MTVERADIPIETYWTDRTAAVAEALEAKVVPVADYLVKDALLYLREHGWTLERER